MHADFWSESIIKIKLNMYIKEVKFKANTNENWIM